MKVTDTSQITQLGVDTPVAKPRQASTPSGGVRVSTDDSARIAAAVASASSTAGSSHATRLEAIETAVRQGTYKPDPQRIAQEILDDAELAARLQAIFGG